MSVAIRLPDSLIEEAKIYAERNFRTVPKQVEYWARLGKAAQENPDLPMEFIKGALIALDEVERGEYAPFEPEGEESGEWK